MKKTLLIAAIVVLIQPAIPAQQGSAVAPAPAAAVDDIFSKWSSSTPGCAVGVAVGGKPVLLKAYGMADLERDVRNSPDTVFEAGSVAKQFTAMAVQLLAHDGKLSIDDPVRKYIPELPDYGQPLTIRHMLTHTSGLRDWGSVQGIAGWPRTTRESRMRTSSKSCRSSGRSTSTRARSGRTAIPASTWRRSSCRG